MLIIKTDTNPSTNEALWGLSNEKPLVDFTVFVTENQTNGHGQRNTSWQSEKGKNLTFSVFKRFQKIQATQHFLLNQAVSLAVLQALEPFQLPQLKMKWPNDIMSGSKKIAGILIETKMQGFLISTSVIGIGLNVNQKSFPGLPNATSIAVILKKEVNKEQLLKTILESLENRLNILGSSDFDPATWYEEYVSHLYGYQEWRPYRLHFGKIIKAQIEGVTAEGKLILQTPDGDLMHMEPKEIEWIYES